MENLDAIVVGYDPVHIYILCPYCGEIHMHGTNNAMKTGDYGHRLAHCRERHSRGYYLKPNEFTLKFEDVIEAKPETILQRYNGPRW